MSTKINIFVSYAHVDEHHKTALYEHLSSLRRRGEIGVWHDREILPGKEWQKEISQNLASSDIVLFLVSSAFINSEYCYSIEWEQAVTQKEAGNSILIPIIVRPCDWEDTPIANHQSLPSEGTAIELWENADLAWLDVVTGLKKVIKDFTPKFSGQLSLPMKPIEDYEIHQQAITWMDDTEVVLSHRKVDKVKLSNIYVPLDMEVESTNREEEFLIESSELILKNPGYYLIFGEEQQGKTSLLKHAFQVLGRNSTPAVYIDAKSISKVDLKKSIVEGLEWQFNNATYDQFISNANKVLLIDNLDEASLNSKALEKLLVEINNDFSYVIVTAGKSFNYISIEIDALDHYEKFNLLGLGHTKRSEIIEKWISLGVEDSITDDVMYPQSDEIKSQLDAVIRKNIVPSKPIYILLMLQMLEANSQQNIELSSYGHCYQQLIYQSFDNAKIHKKEFDSYLNVLTELAWKLYATDGVMPLGQVDQFFEEYKKIYLPVDHEVMLNRLTSHSILCNKSMNIRFKYPYLYYFFVAKKIAEGYSTLESVRETVVKLIENLHREDYANILVFVTHHTKERWVLTEIEKALAALFSSQEPATLSKDELHFMQEFISLIPELVIEQRNIKNEREKRNRELDQLERNEDARSELEKQKTIDEEESLESPDIKTNVLNELVADLPANINKTFKGMEISGQIIRNRHATLRRQELLTLAQHGAFCGLRFLHFFIDVSDSVKNEVQKYVKTVLAENPQQTNSEIQESAINHFVSMTYGVINMTIRKIATSIGSKEASVIYENLHTSEQTPALILLNQAINLHFTRQLDFSSVSETYSKLKNNPVCLRILKEIVIQHIYMFPVGYKEKQRLASLLNLSVATQRLMDRKKIGKA